MKNKSLHKGFFLVLSLLLSLSFLCFTLKPDLIQAKEAAEFSDLDPRAWYWPYVDACLKRGWLNGKDDGRFDTQGELKRGDLCLILYRMEQNPPVYTSVPFDDINRESYYYNAICWGYREGLIKGYDEHSFKAENSITRQDLLTILYRYALSKGPISSYADFSVYEDGDQLADYAIAPLAWGIDKKAIGSTERLEACKAASRAEAAKILIQTSTEPLGKLLRIEVRDQVFYAALKENECAEAFYQRAPFVKWMKEYEGREKYCYIQNVLPTIPTKTGKVLAGDLMLQNDNALTLFYQDFESSYRYTPIAHIDEIERLQSALGSDNLTVHFYPA